MLLFSFWGYTLSFHFSLLYEPYLFQSEMILPLMYPQFNIDRYIPHIYICLPYLLFLQCNLECWKDRYSFFFFFFSSYLFLFQTKSEGCLIRILIVVSLSLSYTFLIRPIRYNIINKICYNYFHLKNNSNFFFVRNK